MKLAIIGSRGLHLDNLESYLPEGVTEIVSGGARGIDRCAARYAREKGLVLTEFLPDYEKFGRRAPLLRNLEIIGYADEILAFWDGVSRGTAFVIREAKRQGKVIRVFINGVPAGS